jgi:hypothetical protein
VQFLDETGELLERYRPPPMRPTFMDEGGEDEPAVVRRQAIPVPKGPVDVW